MIERLKIRNFKSLRDVTLDLGPMNIFIGTNASGKSNFLDALRFLQGLGSGFTLDEILNGKPRSSTSEVWDGIRGGSARARFARAGEEEPVAFDVTASLGKNPFDADYRWLKHRVAFNPATLRIEVEELSEYYTSESVPNVAGSPSFRVRYSKGQPGRPPNLEFERARPVLTQFARNLDRVEEAHIKDAAALAGLLANMQRLDPAPSVLRSYSQAHQVGRMGERGENFAALVQSICRDDARKVDYLSWLRELRPAEVDDVGILRGAVGEPLFMLKEGGEEFPAPVLSDGTLRFAAITAAFFQPDMPGILTLEEIENGIHASRLRLLVELLRSCAASGNTQIMATTHSPMVLAWLNESEYRHTFLCRRDERTGESMIQPLAQVPGFLELAREQSVTELFAEGWLEAAP